MINIKIDYNSIIDDIKIYNEKSEICEQNNRLYMFMNRYGFTRCLAPFKTKYMVWDGLLMEIIKEANDSEIEVLFEGRQADYNNMKGQFEKSKKFVSKAGYENEWTTVYIQNYENINLINELKNIMTKIKKYVKNIVPTTEEQDAVLNEIEADFETDEKREGSEATATDTKSFTESYAEICGKIEALIYSFININLKNYKYKDAAVGTLTQLYYDIDKIKAGYGIKKPKGKYSYLNSDLKYSAESEAAMECAAAEDKKEKTASSKTESSVAADKAKQGNNDKSPNDIMEDAFNILDQALKRADSASFNKGQTVKKETGVKKEPVVKKVKKAKQGLDGELTKVIDGLHSYAKALSLSSEQEREIESLENILYSEGSENEKDYADVCRRGLAFITNLINVNLRSYKYKDAARGTLMFYDKDINDIMAKYGLGRTGGNGNG